MDRSKEHYRNFTTYPSPEIPSILGPAVAAIPHHPLITRHGNAEYNLCDKVVASSTVRPFDIQQLLKSASDVDDAFIKRETQA